MSRTSSHMLITSDSRRTSHSDVTGALLGLELTELTRRELVVLTPTPGQLARVLPLDLFTRLRSGLTVRILHDTAADPWPDDFADLASAGMVLETSVPFPYVLVIRDRTVIYLPHRDPRHPMADRLTRVPSPVVAQSLATAADGIWALAAQRADWSGHGGPPHGGKPRGKHHGGEHHEVVRVLGAGLTDDRAAAQLHMSKRTFARRVAMMMSGLEASTRFQAGVQAAHRGWV